MSNICLMGILEEKGEYKKRSNIWLGIFQNW